MKLEKTDIQKIISFLQSKMKLRLLVLYGSYASGHATRQSDIDLAFIADEDVGSYEIRIKLASDLASLMQVESVDLINMKTIDDVFRFVIVSTGEIVYQDGDFDAYLDLAYTKYLQLNEDRQEILEGFSERFIPKKGWGVA